LGCYSSRLSISETTPVQQPKEQNHGQETRLRQIEKHALETGGGVLCAKRRSTSLAWLLCMILDDSRACHRPDLIQRPSLDEHKQIWPTETPITVLLSDTRNAFSAITVTIEFSRQRLVRAAVSGVLPLFPLTGHRSHLHSCTAKQNS
jgi:hypothetical protein